MAEIPVERKSSMTWLWVLLGIILLGLLIWWIAGDDDDEADLAGTDTALVDTADPMNPDIDANLDAQTEAGAMTIAAILAQPKSYIGREFSGDVSVTGPLTDRGFWIESDGAKMYAIIIDEPREVPLDINAGQRLRISGGTIRAGGTVGDVEGVPLDDDTRGVIADQDAFLIVDEDNIEILQAA